MAIDKPENRWFGKEWTSNDVKRGLRVAIRTRGAAIVAQQSWADGDDVDAFTLVSEDRNIVHPETRTRTEMAEFLNQQGFAKLP